MEGQMKRYLYLTDKEEPIIVFAKHKPSEKDSRRIWTVREFDGKTWWMPPIAEILWGTLSKFTFIGIVKVDPTTKDNA